MAEAGVRELELQTKLDAKEAELEKLLRAKNDSETKSLLELVKQKADFVTEWNEKADLYEKLYKEKEAVVKQWNDNYWIIERAEEQARRVCDWVTLEKFFFVAIRKEPVPKVTLQFLLRNNSVFDITLENEIGGKVEYYATELLREKLFSASPDVVAASGFGWFHFENRLSHEEYDLIIKKDSPGECFFDISKLHFTIKGLRTEVTSQRLKIPPRFRTYLYHDYKADLEKYEHKGR